MKPKIKLNIWLVTIMLAGILFPKAVWAQWEFTGSISGGGGGLGCVLEIERAKSLLAKRMGRQYSTYAECESERQYIRGIIPSGCLSYVTINLNNCICSSCNQNKDIDNISNPGEYNPMGLGQGNPAFTSAPYNALQDAMEQRGLRDNTLNSRGDKIVFYNGKTGDSRFDSEVSKLYERNVARKYFITANTIPHVPRPMLAAKFNKASRPQAYYDAQINQAKKINAANKRATEVVAIVKKAIDFLADLGIKVNYDVVDKLATWLGVSDKAKADGQFVKEKTEESSNKILTSIKDYSKHGNSEKLNKELSENRNTVLKDLFKHALNRNTGSNEKGAD